MSDHPTTPDGRRSPWAPDAADTDPDATDIERTEVIPTLPEPEAHRTRAFPVQGRTGGGDPAGAPPARTWDPEPEPVPHQASWHQEADIARRDPRGSVEFDLQLARQKNRVGTDLGLLLLRLCSLPLILHGLAHLGDFGAFAASLADNPVGGTSPALVAGLVVAGQLALPVLLAVGLVTRLAALAQAVMMAAIHVVWVLASAPVLDPETMVLTSEASLAYAAISLPLVLAGAGRFSIDHAIGASGRERRAEKRAARQLGG